VIRQNIDIEESLLIKLEILSAFEETTAKSMMEKAVSFYVEYMKMELLKTLSQEEKTYLGLFLRMQYGREQLVSRKEIMSVLS
jgi:hypothetical protein